MLDVVRELVWRAVTDEPPVYAGVPVAVFRWLPLSPEELPCFVVGRPTMHEAATPALWTASCPVFAVGRTERDDDAQIELDALASWLHARLWRPWSAERVSLKLTDVEPALIEVAGTSLPAYTATVTVDGSYC